MLAVEHEPSLTQQREGRRLELEAHDVRANLGIGGIGGTVTGPMARYELLDLANVLATRGGDPGSLGRRRDHASQLSHGGERKPTARELLAEPWQRAQGPRRTQTLLGDAR